MFFVAAAVFVDDVVVFVVVATKTVAVVVIHSVEQRLNLSKNCFPKFRLNEPQRFIYREATR